MAFSDMLSCDSVIFLLRKSDIETCGFSDIIFASLTVRSTISLGIAKYHCITISLAQGEYN